MSASSTPWRVATEDSVSPLFILYEQIWGPSHGTLMFCGGQSGAGGGWGDASGEDPDAVPQPCRLPWRAYRALTEPTKSRAGSTPGFSPWITLRSAAAGGREDMIGL